jgi:hypothetical protein
MDTVAAPPVTVPHHSGGLTHIHSAAIGGHQPGFTELTEVVTDAGFGNPEHGSQIANARASSSLIVPAATGTQHAGADMSITGNALGMNPSSHQS